MSYIRFQTGMRCHWSGRSLGVFSAAGRLQDDERVEPYLESELNAALSWFNRNLKVPKSEQISQRSIFWFDRESSQVIGQIWLLINLLRQHDVHVHATKSCDPGQIVYRDEHQIAAIPGQRLQRKLVRF